MILHKKEVIQENIAFIPVDNAFFIHKEEKTIETNEEAIRQYLCHHGYAGFDDGSADNSFCCNHLKG
ncbi:hypothetical protein PN4B1_35990 [Paenibacillus naphthalenovorans]|nr:hypothetical protein PN4B1_35990 [Paenibacillus naphthalenovorans]